MNGNGVTLSPVEPSLQGLGHQFAEQRHGGGMRFLTRGLSQADGQTSGAGRSPPAGRRLPGMPMRVRIVRPSPACTAAQMPLRLWLTNTTCRGSPRHRDRQWRGSASGTGCRTSPAAAARRRPAKREYPCQDAQSTPAGRGPARNPDLRFATAAPDPAPLPPAPVQRTIAIHPATIRTCG